ncbi:MAG: gliding motility protein, partial [Myxococcaceae bacterium]|nr:gliding motility protein [Myxococcaceae bacterium]
MKTAMMAWVAVLGLAACQSPKPGAPGAAAPAKGPVVGGLGTRVAEANASDLRITKDGRFAAYLTDVDKPRLNGAPQYLRVGELFVVGTDGKAPARRLGQGATNAPGGFLFTADSSRVLYLVGYSAADQAGELRVASLADAASASERLGGRVTYFTAGPDSQTVAFVDEGSLKVGPLPAGPFREVATEVTTAVFSPAGNHVYFGRRMALGGGLYQVAVDKGSPTRVADQVGDFHFSADGKVLAFASRSSAGAPGYDLFVTDVTALKPKVVARKVLTFSFGPGDKTLVYTTGDSPQSPGDLFVSKVTGGDPTPLGTKVRDFQFSADGSR